LREEEREESLDIEWKMRGELAPEVTRSEKKGMLENRKV
jgi:hypothetical protein